MTQRITGETLRTFRKAKGFEAQAVATRAGLDKQQFSNIERGKRSIEVNEYAAIMQAMGYSPADGFAAEGSKIAPFLPIVEQLRRFPAEALGDVLRMVESAVAIYESGRAVPSSPAPNGTNAPTVDDRPAFPLR